MSGVDAKNLVRLRVNGIDYGGWKSVEIGAGIERVARDFRLSVTDKWPDATAGSRRPRVGDQVEVLIGDDKVITGWIDAMPRSYDGTSRSHGVAGRSKTADLVDCSAINEPGQWRGLKLERIAEAMAGEYGVSVVTETDTGAAIPDHQIQQGESVFESLDRMMRLRHVLATDDGEGRLVITQPSTRRIADALVYGENILSADAPFDFKDVYSEYRVKGQTSGTDENFGELCSAVGETADPAIRRRRVLLIKQNGQGDGGTCGKRAEFERAKRLTKALEVTYTVQGWRQSTGDLWVPNRIVQVRDTELGLARDMLIAEVTYRLDENGTVAVLRVGPPEGYQAEPPKGKRGKKSGGGADVSGVDEWEVFPMVVEG